MNALSTLFPVFFMIILGMIARIKDFISPEQKEGANHIVFNVLFPILIFNVLFTAKIESSAIFIVLYVLIAFTLSLVLGKCITKFTGKKVGHISPNGMNLRKILFLRFVPLLLCLSYQKCI